jgi:succinate-semialdehyde dehydrogenase/glutarate-semialdehyde dehydrogenase
MATVQALPTEPYPDTRLLIDNQWRDATDGKTLDVVNPATGERIGRVAHASRVDLDLALAAAQRGFDTWRWVPSNERAQLMRAAAGLVRQRADTIARLLTMEQGKPLAEARVEVLAGADIIEWFADEGRRVYGRIVPSRNLAVDQRVLKEPVGPVAAFSPWNFPINQVVRKLGAALATGCSFLVKAPEETPASPAALLAAFVDAGVPAGVVGLVFGDPAEISSYVIPHPVIRKVTFTGSTAVGKELAALAGRHMKRVTMELGGHAPVIVADDADVALAARATGGAKFRNAGQVCISPTRFYVQENVHDKFVAKFAELAAAMPVGDGLDAKNKMGPLANARRIDAMEQMIGDARDHGAKVKTGGERIGNAGYFWQPTVLTDVGNDSKIMNVEPFGPVAAMVRFKKFDEVVEQANRLPYGLASYAFTGSAQNAQAIGDALDSGLVGVNTFGVTVPETPFGGVKESGYGSEGGSEGLEAYLQTKFISQM